MNRSTPAGQVRFFSVVVIGAGHAGIEAANIIAQMDVDVALVTLPQVAVASAPCNPAIGGVAKGQVVREIDALGGLIGKLADISAVQYRTLNSSRGFAVQSTRIQIDKEIYSKNATRMLLEHSKLSLLQENVVSVEIVRPEVDEKTFGIQNLGGYTFKIICENTLVIFSKKLIVTGGTFFRGKLHFGERKELGGRVNSPASLGIAEIFLDMGVYPLRFKTGTPARLVSSSVDFSVMEEQPSDPLTRNFSCLHPPTQRALRQVSCHITWTNSQTMQVIRANRSRSPIFNGDISAIGPRYCPSIEDKANRYPDRDVHHVFVEPEGLELDTLYPNGLSTSLPVDVQEEFLRTIRGFEDVQLAIPGYAVEYDVFDATRLSKTLESKDIPGLFFAGQVNGTSGYEEAAGQGLIAGANAALSFSATARHALKLIDVVVLPTPPF
ncbi:MAG: tRNA uridine-5-carboxymethylaminomethyl(34) synthesis enzyme MnmG [Oligoflexia bacterium]|nr:tRNA uridine-5-carboxymethylaminomethyl(34) synthesis enzyme MnmG [Oligoflexia bacterium]